MPISDSQFATQAASTFDRPRVNRFGPGSISQASIQVSYQESDSLFLARNNGQIPRPGQPKHPVNLSTATRCQKSRWSPLRRSDSSGENSLMSYEGNARILGS